MLLHRHIFWPSHRKRLHRSLFKRMRGCAGPYLHINQETFTSFRESLPARVSTCLWLQSRLPCKWSIFCPLVFWQLRSFSFYLSQIWWHWAIQIRRSHPSSQWTYCFTRLCLCIWIPSALHHWLVLFHQEKNHCRPNTFTQFCLLFPLELLCGISPVLISFSLVVCGWDALGRWSDHQISYLQNSHWWHQVHIQSYMEHLFHMISFQLRISWIPWRSVSMCQFCH